MVDAIAPELLEIQVTASVEKYRETVSSLLDVARQAVNRDAHTRLKRIASPPMPPQSSAY